MPELRKVNAIFISLVKAGANLRETIFKAAVPNADGQKNFEREFVVRKSDDAKQMIYGVVYPAGTEKTPDSQGDWMTPGEVEAAAYRFMKAGRTGNGVDRDHSYQTLDGVYVAESWIVRSGDPIFSAPEDVGAWAAGIRIEDKALYTELKAAGYKGFSIAGVAESIQKSAGTTEPQTTVRGSFLKHIRRLLGVEDTMDEDTRKAIEEVTKAVKSVQEGIAEMKKAMPVAAADGGQATPPVKTSGESPDLQKQFDELRKQVETLSKGGTIAKKPEEVVKEISALLAKKGDPAEFAAELEKLMKGITPAEEKKPEDIIKALEARLDLIEKAKPGSAQVDAAAEKSTAIGLC